MMPVLLTYTTASPNYDYSWARTVAENVGIDSRGRSIRIVEHDDQHHMEQQRMRYGSGNELALEPEEFERQVELNLIEATPTQRLDHQRVNIVIPYDVSQDNQHILDAAAEAEAVEGVTTNTRCEDKFIVHVHAVGNQQAFAKACAILELCKKHQEKVMKNETTD